MTTFDSLKAPVDGRGAAIIAVVRETPRDERDDDDLPVASTTDPDRILNSNDYALYENVPVFVEHTRALKSGRTLTFGRRELERVVERSNRRIEETGDFAPVVVGHTSDNPDVPKPPKIGWAGPFKLGWLNSNRDKYAILADFRIDKDKTQLLNEYPRRSAELWAEDRYEDMYLDPISLLGADTPWSDMGVLYAKAEGGAEKIYYSIMPQAPGAYNCGGFPPPVGGRDRAAPGSRCRADGKPTAPVGRSLSDGSQGSKDNKEKYMAQDDYEALSGDQRRIAQTIVAAVFDSPEWKFLRRQMQRESLDSENETDAPKRVDIQPDAEPIEEKYSASEDELAEDGADVGEKPEQYSAEGGEAVLEDEGAEPGAGGGDLGGGALGGGLGAPGAAIPEDAPEQYSATADEEDEEGDEDDDDPLGLATPAPQRYAADEEDDRDGEAPGLGGQSATSAPAPVDRGATDLDEEDDVDDEIPDDGLGGYKDDEDFDDEDDDDDYDDDDYDDEDDEDDDDYDDEDDEDEELENPNDYGSPKDVASEGEYDDYDGENDMTLQEKVAELEQKIKTLYKAFDWTTNKVVSRERYSKLAQLRKEYVFDELAERTKCRYNKMTDAQFADRCKEICENNRRVPDAIEIPRGLVANAPTGDADRPGAVRYSKEREADFEREVAKLAERNAALGIYKPASALRAEVAEKFKIQ